MLLFGGGGEACSGEAGVGDEVLHQEGVCVLLAGDRVRPTTATNTASGTDSRRRKLLMLLLLLPAYSSLKLLLLLLLEQDCALRLRLLKAMSGS